MASVLDYGCRTGSAVRLEGDVEVLAHEPANPVVRSDKLGYAYEAEPEWST
jgi:hypothetical protein